MAQKDDKMTLSATEEEAMAALLDDNLEDIPDLPEFGTPPKGTYKLDIIGFPYKKINDKLTCEAKFRVAETIELADENATPPKVGMEFSELVWFHNDPLKAKGVLKRMLDGIAPDLGTSNLKELMEKSTGLQVIGAVGNRKDKDDKDKLYASVEVLKLA